MISHLGSFSRRRPSWPLRHWPWAVSLRTSPAFGQVIQSQTHKTTGTKPSSRSSPRSSKWPATSPKWEDTHWDYEKKEISTTRPKAFTGDGRREAGPPRSRRGGGVIHFFFGRPGVGAGKRGLAQRNHPKTRPLGWQSHLRSRISPGGENQRKFNTAFSPRAVADRRQKPPPRSSRDNIRLGQRRDQDAAWDFTRRASAPRGGFCRRARQSPLTYKKMLLESGFLLGQHEISGSSEQRTRQRANRRQSSTALLRRKHLAQPFRLSPAA